MLHLLPRFYHALFSLLAQESLVTLSCSVTDGAKNVHGVGSFVTVATKPFKRVTWRDVCGSISGKNDFEKNVQQSASL